ncbi:MAG: (d)CMP kinase [Lachnospiraceae bacterium]|nr:(d)CMP kinase [Lachnospiraceae bacterium]
MSVLVIGGGAAGMMAALFAAREGERVLLLEKNEKLGKKLYITGKGRCNLTNTAETEAFLGKVFRNPRFLRSALASFDNTAMMSLLEEAGLPLKTERGGRVFPQSDTASDVTRTLEKLLRAAGVKVLLNTETVSLIIKEKRIRGVITRENGRILARPADKVILAMGGLSYPSTGSTGDGFRLAKNAGHTVTDLLPSLVPFNASFAEPVRAAGLTPGDLSGLTIKNVSLKLTAGGKKRFEEQGELMFTHFGITGPLVLSASAFAGDCVLKGEEIGVAIDLKPALTEEQLDQRLIRDQKEAGKTALSTMLGGYLPRALIPVILAQAGLDGAEKAARLSREERGALIRALKGLALTDISLRGFPEAVVTRGGVAVKEIDPKTMESKRVSGLYLTGEMLDLDAATGGYNLQIAWSTGAAAGRAAGRKEKEMEEQNREARQNRHIAIDGPGSSGKSTIAKLVAKETGLVYVDTGAMFRGLAIHFLRKGLDASDEAGITAACEDADVTIAYEDGVQQVYLNGENVTPYLREEKTGQMASASSVYGPVRDKMKELQQKLAREKDVVMDGRDIGTVILPDAFLKIYLTASAEVRAERRYRELLEKGQEADLETIRKELEERDYRDMHREIAPLKQADDAVLIDSSQMTIEEVKDAVLQLYGWEK